MKYFKGLLHPIQMCKATKLEKNFNNLIDKKFEDIEKNIDIRFKKDVQFVLDQVKEFTEVECSVCNKKVYTYPHGGGYYRDFQGNIMCSKECVNVNSSNKEVSK